VPSFASYLEIYGDLSFTRSHGTRHVLSQKFPAVSCVRFFYHWINKLHALHREPQIKKKITPWSSNLSQKTLVEDKEEEKSKKWSPYTAH
jgi:hypothetical protein